MSINHTRPLNHTRPRTRPARFARLTGTARLALATGVGAVALTAGAQAPDAPSVPVSPEPSVQTPTPAVDISSKLQPGQEFRYSIRSRQVRQYQKPDESIVKWITRRSVVISCAVLEPDPAIGPRVRVTFDGLNCTLMTPGKALRYNSDNQYMNVVGAPMTLAMEPIVGASITLTLDDAGVIRRIEGADKLLKEKELRQYAERIVGDDAIDLLLGPIFRPVGQPAGEPGSESEPWLSERLLDFPEFATLDFNERWTIGRRQQDLVSFQVESETTADIDAQWPKGVLKDSRSVGSYTWDETLGRLHHTEINRFYVIELENDPDGPTIAGEEVLTISTPIGDN